VKLSKYDLKLLFEVLNEAAAEAEDPESERIRDVTKKLARHLAETHRFVEPEGDPLLILMDELFKDLQTTNEGLKELVTPISIMLLPERLRPTIIPLHMMGEATALQVAEKTGRDELTEEQNLNELVKLGYAYKRKVGDTTKFSPAKLSKIPTEKLASAYTTGGS